MAKNNKEIEPDIFNLVCTWISNAVNNIATTYIHTYFDKEMKLSFYLDCFNLNYLIMEDQVGRYRFKLDFNLVEKCYDAIYTDLINWWDRFCKKWTHWTNYLHDLKNR